jgi:hypothetical protein
MRKSAVAPMAIAKSGGARRNRRGCEKVPREPAPMRKPVSLGARVSDWKGNDGSALLAAADGDIPHGPRPILAFVGAVPGPVEGRRRRSAEADAVTCLSNGGIGDKQRRTPRLIVLNMFFSSCLRP